MTDEQIARVAHEVNRAFCAALGDDSLKPWDESPTWQRESVTKGVDYLVRNPFANAGDSHRSWLAEKARTGWKYGPVKDEAKREHPCFVPYAELPKVQQAKDHLFLAVVRSLS